MRISSNQISQNNLYILNSSGRATRARRTQCSGLTLGKMFMALLVTFVAVAAMQAFQLNSLLSDAKAVGRDTTRLRAEQEMILDCYVSQKNYLYRHIRD